MHSASTHVVLMPEQALKQPWVNPKQQCPHRANSPSLTGRKYPARLLSRDSMRVMVSKPQHTQTISESGKSLSTYLTGPASPCDTVHHYEPSRRWPSEAWSGSLLTTAPGYVVTPLPLSAPCTNSATGLRMNTLELPVRVGSSLVRALTLRWRRPFRGSLEQGGQVPQLVGVPVDPGVLRFPDLS